jgi:hypothetical protein
MLNPLFDVGEDELPLYLQSDNHSLQITFKAVINKCENHYMARLSDQQHPFIVSWDGHSAWAEEDSNKSSELFIQNYIHNG